MKTLYTSILFLFLLSNNLFPQAGNIPLNYQNPSQYTISKVVVTGNVTLDKQAIASFLGFGEGDIIQIPGDKISEAIKNIWKQRLIDDVQIDAEDIGEGKIILYIKIRESSRLDGYVINGVTKGAANDIVEQTSLIEGSLVSPALIKNTKVRIKNYFLEDGFYNAKINIREVHDSIRKGYVFLNIDVDRGKKLKILNLNLTGNKGITDKELKKQLKKTKQKKALRLFKRSKYIEDDFSEDKQKLIAYYQKNGYRDARIIIDSTYNINNKFMDLDIKVYEGKKYYFGDINWIGNNIYDAKKLDGILNIKKGEVYNKELLDQRLNMNPTGQDVSSLYLDNGHLFFRVNPTEVKVKGDTIDIDMQVYEGKKATINKVLINGNTKTSDHVVLRELRTLPGQKFSRADLIRTQRELAQLGYFDPEQMGINPLPNQQAGTVDIEYSLVEKPNDQLQLSGGWGGVVGFVGTLGLVFNNFSLRNITNTENWDPLPTGDGQRLSLQMRANGKQFQNYSLSFTEPWLGGKKPTSFTVSANRSVQRRFNGNEVTGSLKLSGITLSLGRRLKVPDDYFTLTNSLSYTRYNLDRYVSTLCETCVANNLSFNTTLSRNNIGTNPQFPTKGGSMSLSMTLTPPYSLIDRSIENLGEPEVYKLIEFHKWMFDNSWFVKLTGNRKKNNVFETSKTSRPFVLHLRSHFGFIGSYNKNLELGPFERFNVGGDGLSGFNILLGSDVIGLRGYENNSLPNEFNSNSNLGGIIYDKLVTEIRFPLVTQSVATVFVLGFLEAGNAWRDSKDFNPFEVYRSSGVGVRIFMPAFGMIGIDYGYGFDDLRDAAGNRLNRGQFHFTIGQQLR